MNTIIKDIRKDYTLHSLEVEMVNTNAIEQFKSWFDEAILAKVYEPNAMVLSTVCLDNQPHARVVLVKEISPEGFTFFSNYESNKAQQITKNNKVCLLFFWPELERQVRIEGTVSKISKEASEKYFHSRPKSSQIGAHVSAQSTIIEDRTILELRQMQLTEKYEGQIIPLPDNWGGYLVNPTSIEFWQGRASRLHDRLLYTLASNKWTIARLAP